jgi:23S rRNA (uracil1939-C5)-methyltransferase
MVVFVPFTVTGDEAVIEIVELKRRYAKGRMIRVLIPSPERTTPACPYYIQCGGCQYQHIHYAAQLKIKKMHVIDAFERLGKFNEPPVAVLIRSPRSFGYRGKAEFQIARGGHGKWIAGFMHSSSHNIIDIESCMILDDSINESYRQFREDILSRQTMVKYMEKRIFWSNLDGRDPMKQALGTIMRIVKDKSILVSSQGFFQANNSLTEKLVDEVVSMCSLSGQETVLDAFCGSGLFSLFLAAEAKKVYGIEMDPEAVAFARINLNEAGYVNTTIINGDVAAMMKKRITRAGSHVDVLVCDPPRLGLNPKAMAAIIEMQPAKIVYVSCNPATQARDMRVLANQGYMLKRLQPIDMFPQTAHIEVVGLMEK